jgi:hypothetical protein
MGRDGRSRHIVLGLLLAVAAALVFSGSAVAKPRGASSSRRKARWTATGSARCSSRSTRRDAVPTIRGFPGDGANLDEGRFSDNGHYIGHDEPDLTFLSNRPGSGNDVTWTETLGG